MTLRIANNAAGAFPEAQQHHRTLLIWENSDWTTVFYLLDDLTEEELRVVNDANNAATLDGIPMTDEQRAAATKIVAALTPADFAHYLPEDQQLWASRWAGKNLDTSLLPKLGPYDLVIYSGEGVLYKDDHD